MRRYSITTLALAACMLLTQPRPAQARTSIKNAWQAYYTPCQALIDLNCAACHQNGYDFNSYGEQLRHRILDLGMSDTDAFGDADTEDADGDGYTNGQEIVIDCTLPYDASSHGAVADDVSTWGRIKALYR